MNRSIDSYLTEMGYGSVQTVLDELDGKRRKLALTVMGSMDNTRLKNRIRELEDIIDNVTSK